MKRAALLLVLFLGGCECSQPRSCKLWWCDGGRINDAGDVECEPPPPLDEWPAHCVTDYTDGGTR